MIQAFESQNLHINTSAINTTEDFPQSNNIYFSSTISTSSELEVSETYALDWDANIDQSKGTVAEEELSPWMQLIVLLYESSAKNFESQAKVLKAQGQYNLGRGEDYRTTYAAYKAEYDKAIQKYEKMLDKQEKLAKWMPIIKVLGYIFGALLAVLTGGLGGLVFAVVLGLAFEMVMQHTDLALWVAEQFGDNTALMIVAVVMVVVLVAALPSIAGFVLKTASRLLTYIAPKAANSMSQFAQKILTKCSFNSLLEMVKSFKVVTKVGLTQAQLSTAVQAMAFLTVTTGASMDIYHGELSIRQGHFVEQSTHAKENITETEGLHEIENKAHNITLQIWRDFLDKSLSSYSDIFDDIDQMVSIAESAVRTLP